MKTVKNNPDDSYVFIDKLLRQLGKETGAFDVRKVEHLNDLRHEEPSGQWDYRITLSTTPDNRPKKLFIETKSEFTPQAVVAIAKHFRQTKVPPNQLVLYAPYVSKRVTEVCREQSVGYLDEVGNCRIAFPGLFIEISGRLNRRARRKPVDPFSRKSSRIVRTLLMSPERSWQVQVLAKKAEVSLGLASKVKNKLIEDAYLEERNRLLYLRDPEKLLQAWAAQYQPDVKRLSLFTTFRPLEAESRLADWCRSQNVPYALTQLSGAWRISPTVRYDKSVFYIDKKNVTVATFEALLSQIDAKEVDTGANCTLWITDDPAVFTGATDIDGVTVVSPIQLYLDLTLLAGRGGELAQEIMEQQLRHFLSPNKNVENKP